MKRLTILAFALVGILGLTACSDDVTGPTGDDKSNPLDPTNVGQTIAEVAEANGFTLLLGAVDYIAATNPDSRVVAQLLDSSKLTVFAPTDQAFLDLVAAVESLLDPDILANEGPFAAIDALLGAGTIEAVVSYHITGGSRDAASVVPMRGMGDNEIKTLLTGATFLVNSDAMINAVGNSAQITLPDVYATNGIIHVIDTVILPIQLELGAPPVSGNNGLDLGTLAHGIEGAAQLVAAHRAQILALEPNVGAENRRKVIVAQKRRLGKDRAHLLRGGAGVSEKIIHAQGMWRIGTLCARPLKACSVLNRSGASRRNGRRARSAPRCRSSWRTS